MKGRDTDSRGLVTRLLLEMESGEGPERTVDRLMPLIYEELQGIARRHLRRERRGHTLNTTALVHEAYLKLVDQRQAKWQNRAHFFAFASTAMRRILVNHAKHRRREKRGGGAVSLSLDTGMDPGTEPSTLEVVALDEALTQLSTLSERAGQVVECRFFGGLTIEETAAALDIAPMTVKREWLLAKTWLRRALHPSEGSRG